MLPGAVHYSIDSGFCSPQTLGAQRPPANRKSHPASVQLCAEASAASPQVKASVRRGKQAVLSPLTSLRVHSGPPDHLYVCHSMKQAVCSWPRCDCMEKEGSAAIWGS